MRALGICFVLFFCFGGLGFFFFFFSFVCFLGFFVFVFLFFVVVLGFCFVCFFVLFCFSPPPPLSCFWTFCTENSGIWALFIKPRWDCDSQVWKGRLMFKETIQRIYFFVKNQLV
jgi:hypothetical protein